MSLTTSEEIHEAIVQARDPDPDLPVEIAETIEAILDIQFALLGAFQSLTVLVLDMASRGQSCLDPEFRQNIPAQHPERVAKAIETLKGFS